MNPQYAIEDVSLASTPRNRLAAWPQFGAMNVGQSFLVPNLPSGRSKPVPFDAAQKAFGDRKFRRTKEATGTRYGRIK